MITVSELMIYPLKSAQGISLQASYIDTMGLQYDRRWMLIDENNKFVSQRTVPKLALVATQLDSGKLTLTLEQKATLNIPEHQMTMPKIAVDIWGDIVDAIHLDVKLDQQLSEFLNQPVRLVYIDDSEVRQCDLEFSKKGDRTGFADGFPILVISEASLNDLNSRLDVSVSMKNFRPNIVVNGCDAYAEDTWKNFNVNNLSFRGVKPCSRCVLTTVDPKTGIKNKQQEPLRTLVTYRKQGSKVLFGQNVIHDNEGTIEVGNELNIES